MGSYGIGVGRLLACVAEEHHDEYGLVWPVTIAPYQVHLILLRGKGTPQAEETAERLYADLKTAGLEVLYDDRDESPGVKFNDADLIGLPVRLTVSERALGQGGVELKLRRAPEKTVIPLGEVIQKVQETLQALQAEIAARVVPVEYNG
jgi:prolyl-tRNA synthetase